MSLADARVIDIHAHAVMEETFGTAGEFGPELTEEDGVPVFRIGSYKLRGVKYRGSAFMDPEVRVAAMDRAGIDWQLLSPNPLTYFHFIPAAEAIAFCRRHNDTMAALASARPDRLGGAAALPMQDVPAAIAELRRAVRELGLKAAYIGTDMPHGLDDPSMDAFYETVCELDVPLFIHPAPAGIDGPAASPALSKYELDIMLGFTMQESIAVATLLFGGVLHRHPRLDVCISHGGGALALVWGRLEHAAHKRAWAPDHLHRDGAFAEQLGRLWYDIHMHDDRALELLVERVGTDRLVYGTNFAGWDAPEKFRVPTMDVPLADNARRLLRG
ncbi:amidohydrolase family protein [Paraurantiacibacter namhicola]|uniref:Amidohydrolase n=1 Tax=Paraurantiacibacter namhicola TaxID=645517 RepID=A0A1C7DA99_9SPHN|nr:amidohydrolase family protein [Paraurantiacibacter namhicola]ANU08419.1 Amidohydrolase [Paraurantiacibacter namhicola]